MHVEVVVPSGRWIDWQLLGLLIGPASVSPPYGEIVRMPCTSTLPRDNAISLTIWFFPRRCPAWSQDGLVMEREVDMVDIVNRGVVCREGFKLTGLVSRADTKSLCRLYV